jgi:VCBS repeat-containing protein
MEIDKTFTIAGKKIAAGTYAIFTIPSNGDWIFILNKNYQQHLTDEYDAKDDLIRLTVKPISSNTVTERLQYFIEENKLAIAWEKIKIEIPLTVQQ